MRHRQNHSESAVLVSNFKLTHYPRGTHSRTLTGTNPLGDYPNRSFLWESKHRIDAHSELRHSVRNAFTGSSDAALCAGMIDATSAHTASSPTAVVGAAGSQLGT